MWYGLNLVGTLGGGLDSYPWVWLPLGTLAINRAYELKCKQVWKTLYQSSFARWWTHQYIQYGTRKQEQEAGGTRRSWSKTNIGTQKTRTHCIKKTSYSEHCHREFTKNNKASMYSKNSLKKPQVDSLPGNRFRFPPGFPPTFPPFFSMFFSSTCYREHESFNY